MGRTFHILAGTVLTVLALTGTTLAQDRILYTDPANKVGDVTLKTRRGRLTRTERLDHPDDDRRASLSTRIDNHAVRPGEQRDPVVEAAQCRAGETRRCDAAGQRRRRCRD